MIDDAIKTEINSMNFKELAEYYDALSTKISESDRVVKDLKEIATYLTEVVVPDKLDGEGMVNTTITTDNGKRRWQLSTQANCSILADHRTAMYRWLEDNGHGALIVDTVNSSTFKAFVLEQKRKGATIPEEYISLHMYSKASLVKA